jgi:phosphoglycerate kinase
MRAFATLDDADIKNKRVLVRVDLNVPVVGGKVTDRTRIERIAPTIIELIDKGGKVILLSHFGRPIGRDPKQSLKLLAPAIADVLKRRPKISMSFLRWAALLITALKPGTSPPPVRIRIRSPTCVLSPTLMSQIGQ